MSATTYTCEQCGDTGRDALQVIGGQNWCGLCIEQQGAVICALCDNLAVFVERDGTGLCLECDVNVRQVTGKVTA
jgi:hypothetical protein